MRKLSPIRPPLSHQLDDRTVPLRGGGSVVIPAARPWPEAYARLATRWEVGHHLALIARTRSGKTTFARAVLDLRDWVVVFGTKPRDPDLYDGFVNKGYVIKDKWSPDDLENRRVIFRPPGNLLDTESQARAFTEALGRIYEVGGWTVYLDEILVLSEDLGMKKILNRMYTQAGSNEVTMVAGTQRPVVAPRNMFTQSEWFAMWKIPDQEDRDSASEKLGENRQLAREAMKVLPQYEFLLVDTADGSVIRSKVT